MLYYDGRHYDRRIGHYNADIPFYLKQARTYGDPILELACGTGRITILLAKEGFETVGLDISEYMLVEAARKSEEAKASVMWVHGDSRDFNFKLKFSMVFYPFNSMCHLLTFQHLEACLASVKRHMHRKGRFIFDVFNPRLDLLLRDASKRYPHSVYAHPDGAGPIEVTENNVYDDAAQINTVRLYFRMPDGSEGTENLVLRMWYPQELDALLGHSGFEIEHKYGDFDESPFRSGSPRQVVICKPGTH